METLKRLFAYYVESSIHVALSVVALTAITVLEFEVDVPIALWFFVFLAALSGYNFIKYVSPLKKFKARPDVAKNPLLWFTAMCFLGLLYVSFQMTTPVLFITVLMGFLTFFYANPLFRHKNLRVMAGLKIFVVSLVWGGVTVIIPMMAAKADLNLDVWITFLQRALLVVVLMIPFELRDMQVDALSLKTLPQQIGVRPVKILGGVLLILIFGMEFLKVTGQMAYLVSLFVFTLALGGLLVLSKTKQKPYFASFWVESLPVCWLLLFVLIKEGLRMGIFAHFGF